MKIANLSYDTYFKYLMEDDRAARVLLGALLGCKVTEVKQGKNEIVSTMKGPAEARLNMFRLDFSAKVVDESGKEKSVYIELQRARNKGDVMRFRQYIGAHYQDVTLKDEQGEPIPIVVIYILGHNLPGVGYDEPVLYVRQDVRNRHKVSMNYTGGCSYIDGLTHGAIFVQLPKVKVAREGGILDVLLSYFAYDQDSSTIDVASPAEYELDREGLDDVIHVQDRLRQATYAPELYKKIELELEAEARVREYEESVVARKRLDKEMKVMAEGMKVMEEEIKEKDKKIESMKEALRKMGMTEDEIRKMVD